MTPFLTEEEAAAGEEIAKVLMPQLQKLNPKACIAALSMCLTFACDATQIPMESVFQVCRNLRKALGEATKAIEAGQIVSPSGELVVPDEPKIVVP